MANSAAVNAGDTATAAQYLLDVRPGPSVDDAADVTARQPECPADFRLRLARRVPRADLADDGLGEAGRGVGLAATQPLGVELGRVPVGSRAGAVAVAGRGAALGHAVGGVLGAGADEEVVRVDAAAVVAAVQDRAALRYRAVGQLPGQAVGEHQPLGDRHHAVAVSVERAGPVPAVAGLLDARPEAVGVARVAPTHSNPEVS